MKIRFETKTGSVYVLDNEEKSWMREATTDKSGKIRSESGSIVGLFPSVLLNFPVVIFTEPSDSTPEGTDRFVRTSPVKRILSVETTYPVGSVLDDIKKTVDEVLKSLETRQIEKSLIASLVLDGKYARFTNAAALEEAEKYSLQVFSSGNGDVVVMLNEKNNSETEKPLTEVQKEAKEPVLD